MNFPNHPAIQASTLVPAEDTTTMAAPKLALAGATGLLGTPLLDALLSASYDVLVLTRSGSSSSSSLPKSPNLTVQSVDYKDEASLTKVLKDNSISIVISTLGVPALGDQLNLINAAFASGTVTRFIPSEFGSDTSNPNNVDLPVYAGKVASRKRLEELSSQNPNFTYTIFYNQLFLDSGLTSGFIINPKTHTARIYEGGDVPVSVTRLSTIAKGVVGVLAHLNETQNRNVYVHDAVTTQNKLIDMVKSIDGKEWELTHLDTKTSTKESFAELQKENPDVGKAMYGFLPAAIYGEGSGGSFEGKTDNKLLGLEALSEEELRDVVVGIIKGQ